MKLRNKKGLVLGIVALSAVAITSVGFAAWVITTGDTEETTGNIVVDSVGEDKVHTVTTTWVKDSSGTALGNEEVGNQIVFGRPATMNASNAWLTNDSETLIEKLTVYLKVEIANTDTFAEGDRTTYASLIKSLEFVETTESYATAATANYVGSLPAYDATAGAGVGTITAGTVSYDSSAKKSSFVYTIEFKWGSAFGNVNPYNYYNDGVKTAEEFATEAKTKLNGVYAANSAAFKLTIESKAA